jgi:enoyl-CoA hydratase
MSADIPDFELINYTVQDHLAIVSINRPDALNALNMDVFMELAGAVDVISQDPDVKAAIFTGQGKAFAAGADIAQVAALEDVFAAREFSILGQSVMSEIGALPVPSIAAINGFALGGGLELALACDLRVASTKAKLGMPEVGLGLIPGFGGTQRLPRLIGRGRALDLILTGRHLAAEEALSLGLVNRVAEDALEAAKELARSIITNGPVALALAKEALGRGEGLDLQDALEVEADLFGLASATKDMKEGTKAFLEKRPARFIGE